MEDTKQEEGRGAEGARAPGRVRLRTLCAAMLAVACVLLAALIAVAVYISRHCQGAQEMTEAYIAAEKSNLMLRNASDYLTDQARGYAATMDFRFVENYYEEINVTKRRETAVDAIKAAHPNTPACTFMATAYRYSNELVWQEVYAMRLMAEASGEPEEKWPEDLRAVRLRSADQLLSPEEKAIAANELVYGDPYSITKTQIIQNLDYSLNDLYETLKEEMAANAGALAHGIRGESALFILLFLETAGAVVLMWVLLVRPLRIYMECLRREKLVRVSGACQMGSVEVFYENVEELNDASRLMAQEENSRDALTGLLNRAAFLHVKKLLGGREAPVGLVLLNVNDFHKINEQFGHETGDRVLRRVAALLTERFRVTDSIARIGGNEFALILPGLRAEQQEVVIGKINALNESLVHPADNLPSVSLSAGAAFSVAGFTEDLYQKAGLALYEVRENGHSGCHVYAAQDTDTH